MPKYEFLKGTEVIEVVDCQWVEASKKLAELNKIHMGGIIVRKQSDKKKWVIEDALVVDCWTSGNPGEGGYQVVLGDSKNQTVTKIFRMDCKGSHTNNYYELLAVKEGLEIATKLNITKVYSDSMIAIAWSKGNGFNATQDVESIRKVRDVIKTLLAEHPQLQLLKWDTETYGENPADFGRK